MVFKILQITHKPPFPEIDGGCLEIAKMSKNYDSSNHFELDICSLSTYKHPFKDSEFKKYLSDDVTVNSVYVTTKPSFFKAVSYFFSSESYNLNRFVNKQVIEKLTKIVQEKKYDFIQFESIYAAQYSQFLKPITKAKLILNAPNVEYNLWNEYASKSSSIKKWYFNSLAKRLKKHEISIWKKMDGIICITNDIKETIRQEKIEILTLVLPFKLNINEYKGLNTKNKIPSFFHIGAMDWEPNKEGIDWFLDKIWETKAHSSTLHLAGKGINNNEYEKHDSITVHGFVEDAKEFINSHDIMVVPLLTGSGMRIKIIEAMALGKCVISTSKGAEGINYSHKQNIWIANSELEFKTAINQFIENSSLAVAIGENSRKLIEKEYNSNKLDTELIPFFEKLK